MPDPADPNRRPGETPRAYRERIHHVPTDPRTWGAFDAIPEAHPSGCCVRQACGCEVVGNGTLPYPYAILRCAAHGEPSVPAGGVLAALVEASAHLARLSAALGFDVHLDGSARQVAVFAARPVSATVEALRTELGAPDWTGTQDDGTEVATWHAPALTLFVSDPRTPDDSTPF